MAADAILIEIQADGATRGLGSWKFESLPRAGDFLVFSPSPAPALERWEVMAIEHAPVRTEAITSIERRTPSLQILVRYVDDVED